MKPIGPSKIKLLPPIAQSISAIPKERAALIGLRPQSSFMGRDERVRNMAGSPDEPLEDLVQVLCHHAAHQPDQPAFVFLRDGDADELVLTFGQLDRGARAIAARLQAMDMVGQRVLLAYPPGVDFITGFFGCLYAGCTAVPVNLPHRRTLESFRAIVVDAQARLVLSTRLAARQHQTIENRQANGGVMTPWLATDAIGTDNTAQWKRPAIAPHMLAMLQYTSGSTSQPKGVMLSHANLMHNTRAIGRAFDMGCDTGMFWLPAYHDMGLVGGVLEPLLAGITCVLMAPAAFLQRPIAWLSAISRYRATISGGPNFAYDLCVRKITDEQRATLDLSCWSLAFVGAEPIVPETLERFAAAFAPCGFKPAAFYPCYGLAEATLMVTGATRGHGVVVRSFDEAALMHNVAQTLPANAVHGRRLVSSGRPVDGLRIAIVDGQTGTQAPDGHVGEIWLAGPSIAMGYWNKPEQTGRSFEAPLHGSHHVALDVAPHVSHDASHLTSGDTTPFFRTGDMGFLLDGELYVTGRIDDLLVVRGRNHHPQDLEAAVRQSHAMVIGGIGAVFSVTENEGAVDNDQRIVLVQEISRNGEVDFAPVLKAMRAAVLDEHGLVLHTIVLVRGGTIPRTSSGKVQRRACRTAFLSGKLVTIAQSSTSDAIHPVATVAATAEKAGQSLVLAAVVQHALALSGAALADVTPDMRLTALGLDSLQRAELATTLEKTFACRLPDTDFNPSQTLGELAIAVQKHLVDTTGAAASTSEAPAAHYDFKQFPEYGELKRYESMLKVVAGESPYFRVDQGGTCSASISRISGRDRINFGVYDYIGMAHDGRVAAAAKAAIDHYGTSAGASRLVSGDKQVHRDLEQALASFLGTHAALVFVSGHATNVTTIGHLMGPEDLIVHDVLAHNSIILGAQLSGATRRIFAHNDWRAMDGLLSEMRHRYRRVLIAIEGAYSMDGDFPDLPRFIEMKKKHKALMLVDEAHSLGTMGATGRGIGEHWGVARTDVDLWMGTLSKSLGSCGGYIAGSAELVEYLGYTAPGVVYSVGLSPPNAAAALAALTLLKAQPQRVARLRELAALFLHLAGKAGLNTGSAAGTPVIPVIVGNSVKSLRLARTLFERGINVQPILHPAVPEHSARLRFFITTNHTEQQIRSTVNAVACELARL